jgi:hypothetical protein
VDAANRSGVDLGYIDRLIELGVISPDSTDRLTKGDVRRAQMAQTLENAGIALDSLAASIKGGHGDLGFVDAPSYERFATLSDETFEGLSRRTGLPLNLLMLIPEVTGYPDQRSAHDFASTLVGLLFQPNLGGLSAILRVPAYAIASWLVAIVSPAVHRCKLARR